MPILFISGLEDAAGTRGKEVPMLVKRYTAAGYHEIESCLVPDARHEVLNELDRHKTYAFILDWLNRHL